MEGSKALFCNGTHWNGTKPTCLGKRLAHLYIIHKMPFIVSPSPPSLSIYIEGTKTENPSVSKGDYVTLSCKSGGGNPGPALTLYLGGEIVGTSVPGSTLQYTFTVQTVHDAVHVYCAANSRRVNQAVHSQSQVIKLRCKKIVIIIQYQISN